MNNQNQPKRPRPSTPSNNAKRPSGVPSGTPRPAANRPRPDGARPQNPRPDRAARPQNPRPVNAKAPIKKAAKKPSLFDVFKKKAKPEPAPKKRVNEQSYVFSRSLSETQERILEERRERLEDAKKFQQEDVRWKLRIGAIAFIASILTVAIIISLAVSCSLSTDKVKKNRGEYIYNIGKTSSSAAYADSVRNGAIYISMNSISELCELTMSGSTSELRFTAKGGDWISFSPNSNEAKINGYGIKMPAPAYIEDTSCSVPLEFLEYVLSGIKVEVDYAKNTVTVTRNEYSDSTPLEPHYTEVAFSLKADSVLTPLDENKYFAGQPLFSFKNDLSAYESYMNPTNKSKYLTLVNKQNPIGSDYEPDDLVYVEADVPKAYWLDSVAAKAAEAMLMEMYSEGLTDVYVTSGYRSYGYQDALYNTYIDNEMSKNPSLSYYEAEQIVKGYSAVPGESEHHTGLCIDLISSTMTDLDESFAELEAYDWLMANAWKFGFVLRYPEGKTEITEYDYEPWHWRFVGRETALEMLRSGECFEEYIARTSTAEG